MPEAPIDVAPAAPAATPATSAAPAAPATPAAAPTLVSPGAAAVDPKTPAVDPAKPAADPAATPDWRTRIAGENKDFLKVLSRYTDEAAFGKAHHSLLQKMSSGELKKPLAENATPEEVATWRKENGLPEKPEGYLEKLELPKGMVLGEADKPIIAEFAQAAMESNADPKAFSALVSKYYKMQEQQIAARDDADAQFKQASEDDLRKDWQGADFRRNVTAVNNLIAAWPTELATGVLAARTPDGRKLGDDPRFIRQLAALALELNPASTLVPAGTSDPSKGVDSRLAEIRKFRQDNPDKYEADKKMQAEEIQLLDAQLKMNKRSAA